MMNDIIIIGEEYSQIKKKDEDTVLACCSPVSLLKRTITKAVVQENNFYKYSLQCFSFMFMYLQKFITASRGHNDAYKTINHW